MYNIEILKNEPQKKIGKKLSKFPALFRIALYILTILDILIRLIKRLIKLPIKLLRANFLIIKNSIIGKRYIIDPADATFFGDGFCTTLHVEFLNDKKLNSAYEKSLLNVDPKFSKNIRYINPKWRAHIVTWAAKQAIKLDGDFIACGVYWGLLEKTICEYVDFGNIQDKKFFLIDTWGDPKTNYLNHQKYKYSDNIFSLVKNRFNEYSNVKLIRGPVPEILKEIPITKISYLSIDMNGYIAERATLEKYYDKIVPGGIIYFDDYGWNYPKLRDTINEFFSDKPETLLHFPSGNSIVIKL